jgi:hypothetical protein
MMGFWLVTGLLVSILKTSSCFHMGFQFRRGPRQAIIRAPWDLYSYRKAGHPVDNASGYEDNPPAPQGKPNIHEAMFSVAYDPLQLPDQTTLERDLEDM